MSERIEIHYDPPSELPPAAVAAKAPAARRIVLPYWMRKFRAALLAVAAALVLRAIFLEPFGVPTGSMATTILGQHRSAFCADCGNLIRVGVNHYFHKTAALAHLKRSGDIVHRHFGDLDIPPVRASFGLAQSNPPELRIE